MDIEYANTPPPTRAIFEILKVVIEVKRRIICFSSWDKLTENRSDLRAVCGHIQSKFHHLHHSLLYSTGQMKYLRNHSIKTDSSVPLKDGIYTFIISENPRKLGIV